MEHYQYKKGKEIKTIEDAKGVEVVLIEESLGCNTKHISAYDGWILRSQKNIDDIVAQGGHIFERVKVERIPVFSKDIDDELDGILVEFAMDYSNTDFGCEKYVEQVLQKLYKILEVRR